MSAVTVLRVPPDGWTVDDLPDREDFRYELVDGALLVTPTPSVRHAFAASRLHAALLAAVPVGVEVISPGVTSTAGTTGSRTSGSSAAR
jgi:hypothetical protein